MAAAMPPEKPLETLADFTRWFTTLALGGLAFGVGLQQFVADYPQRARGPLIDSWWCFGAAAAAGVLLQSAFPVLFEQRRFSLTSWWLRVPYWFLALGTVLGAVLLAISLHAIFTDTLPPERLAIKDAAGAVLRVRALLGPRVHLTGVSTVENIKGAAQSSLRDVVWHVRASVRDDRKRGANANYAIDVFVRAADGSKVAVGP